MLRPVVVALAACLALSACAGDDDGASTAVAPPADPLVADSVPGVDPAEKGTGDADSGESGVDQETEPRQTTRSNETARASQRPAPVQGTVVATSQPSAGAISFIADVRSARHPSYDRVVFEFENAIPGYRVGWVARPITVDASGRETDIDGAYVLEVRLEPSSRVDLDQPGPNGYRETYAGPRRVVSDTRNVTEVVEGTDFEAQAIWLVGFEKAPGKVSVMELTGPSRLVIDAAF
jgi:hypothetical protein